MDNNNISSVKELLVLIEEKIKNIKEEIELNNNSLDSKKKDEKFIEELQNNFLSIANESVYSRITSLLVGLTPQELSDYLVDIEILKIVADASEFGEVELNSEEQKMFDKLISKLKSISDQSKKEAKDSQKKNSEIEKKAVKYGEIYDKFRNGKDGDQLIDDTDIDIVLDLIKTKDFDFNKSILSHILSVNSSIYEKRVNAINGIIYDDDNDDVNVEEIPESLIKDLFEKYGFEYDSMPNKLKIDFRTKVKYANMVDIFQFIDANPEYNFLRSYGKPRIFKKEETINREFNVLFNILRSSSVEILSYLLNDSKNRNVQLFDMFEGIPGIYKLNSVKGVSQGPTPPGIPSDIIPGCYQNYRKNEKLFDDLSKKYRVMLNDNDIDFYSNALEFSPTIFSANPDTLEKNIKYAELYGINLLNAGNIFRTPTMLLAPTFCESVDVLIENGCAHYLSRYSSVLREDNTIKKIIYKYKKGELEFDSIGRLRDVRQMDDPDDLYDIVNRDSTKDIEKQIPDSYKLAASSSISTVTKPIVDNIVVDLDENYKSTSYRNTIGFDSPTSLAYDINGTLVSIKKFNRVWTALQLLNQNSQNPIDEDKLLMYSLTYGSYYSKDEVKNLQKFVDQKYGKGNK